MLLHLSMQLSMLSASCPSIFEIRIRKGPSKYPSITYSKNSNLHHPSTSRYNSYIGTVDTYGYECLFDTNVADLVSVLYFFFLGRRNYSGGSGYIIAPFCRDAQGSSTTKLAKP